MDSGNERLFRVLSDVGSDLIATAEQRTFARSPWQRILPAAACLLLVGGLALAAAPYFVARPETAYAPAAPTADAVVEESKPEEVVIPEAVEEYAAVPEVQNEAAMGPVGAREQLVFWDTVYYVEATNPFAAMFAMMSGGGNMGGGMPGAQRPGAGGR